MRENLKDMLIAVLVTFGIVVFCTVLVLTVYMLISKYNPDNRIRNSFYAGQLPDGSFEYLVSKRSKGVQITCYWVRSADKKSIVVSTCGQREVMFDGRLTGNEHGSNQRSDVTSASKE